MWQVLIGVFVSTGTLLIGFLILTKIVLKTTEETARVLVASLTPPITQESQPQDQPTWGMMESDGLPIPPMIPGWTEESSRS